MLLSLKTAWPQLARLSFSGTFFSYGSRSSSHAPAALAYAQLSDLRGLSKKEKASRTIPSRDANIAHSLEKRAKEIELVRCLVGGYVADDFSSPPHFPSRRPTIREIAPAQER